jgi:integrase
MAGVRKKPRTVGGKYQAWFINTCGKRQYFTGTTDREETLYMARRLEDDHRQVRLGYRPASTSAERHRARPFPEVRDEYLDWGEVSGGLRGRPWGEYHAKKRRTHLHWWGKRLSLGTLADFDGLLPRVEKAIRHLYSEGKAGKTLANYAEALTAFCVWSVQRGYLADDPLKSLRPIDTTPRTKRRAMTESEIALLLDVCGPHRRLLYETALLSGLRANELRSLSLDHLDSNRLGLNLDAEWTKNRKAGFQHLSGDLVARLRRFADEGVAEQLYGKFYKRRDATRRAPPNPLLFVPLSLSRDFDKDLSAAGISKWTPDGKLDFHALRLTYINLVLDSDISAREAQAMARHATLDMTLDRYGRARHERMAEAVEGISKRLISAQERVPRVYRIAVGSEGESATAYGTSSCADFVMVEQRGIEPLTSDLQSPRSPN